MGANRSPTVAAPNDASKVLDFGLARAGRGQRADDPDRRGGGTPAYMSPEQVDGLSVDARSDLVQLAACLTHGDRGGGRSGATPDGGAISVAADDPPPAVRAAAGRAAGPVGTW